MILTLVAMAAFVLLAFLRVSAISWLLAFMVFVPVLALHLRISDEALQVMYVAMFLLLLLFAVPPVRQRLVTPLILPLFRRFLPALSATEQSVMKAHTPGWESELFSGYPDWDKLCALPGFVLKPEEHAFLGNETEQLCAMLDSWKIAHEQDDLPPSVWTFLRDRGFFGLAIPKQYGGREFSAQAQSAIFSRIASRSMTAAVIVMTANLDLVWLLLRYGTQIQKDRYLPRLATGEEISCLVLGENDFEESQVQQEGVVCRADFGGERNVLGFRLNWDQCCIPLAPVATLLGLAFRLRDPECLLGGEVDRGVTLALIPAILPGVALGKRHIALDSTALAGPTRGDDVFIPLEFVLGDVAQLGQGASMLAACQLITRAISSSASSAGMTQLAARSIGAYARILQPSGSPIGKNAGVEALLARMAGNTYLIDAVRRMSAVAIELDAEPLVISGIVKYHTPERARQVINDAMDIAENKGVCLGPGNLLGRFYQQIPQVLALRGGNIDLRAAIFRQAVMRAHPYLNRELAAVREADVQQARMKFDRAFFGHVGFVFNNAARSLVFGIFGALIPVPRGVGAPRYFRHLTRYAAAFALCGNVAMAMLGGSLKRRERSFARLGDVLSLLYLGSAMLKRFEESGRQTEDRPLLDWTMQDTLWRIQETLSGVLHNLPFWPVRILLRFLVFPLGRCIVPPSDALGHRVAQMLMRRDGARDRLTRSMYLPHDESEPLGVLEAALASTVACEVLQRKLDAACHAGKLSARDELARIAEARACGLINPDQALRLERDYALRCKVASVDAFSPEDLPTARKGKSSGRRPD
jgi:acyl-CoA dehydrogenase